MHQISLCIAVVGFVASASSAVYGQSRPAGDRIGQQSRMASRSDNDRVVGVISGGTEGTYIRIAADLANVLDSPDLRILPSSAAAPCKIFATSCSYVEWILASCKWMHGRV